MLRVGKKSLPPLAKGSIIVRSRRLYPNASGWQDRFRRAQDGNVGDGLDLSSEVAYVSYVHAAGCVGVF